MCAHLLHLLHLTHVASMGENKREYNQETEQTLTEQTFIEFTNIWLEAGLSPPPPLFMPTISPHLLSRIDDGSDMLP